MADTFDPFLKIRLPETGAYNNSWGTVLNADAFTLLAHAITGEKEVAIGSSLAYSLAALADGAAADARYFCLKITGTPASAFTFTLPGTVPKKFYLIDNQTTQSATIKYASGTTVVVPTLEKRLVWCDGTNVTNVYSSASDTAALGGIAAAYYARLDIANVFSGRASNPFVTVTEGATTTVNAASGNHQILTLTGNRTMAAPTNPVDGQELLLVVLQDGTGGRTLTWNAVFEFENGTAPILATVAGAKDLFFMIYNSALTKWLVMHGENVSSGSGSTYNMHIEENTTDWNLLAKLGALGAATTLNLTIDQGVVIQALSTGTFALDLSGSLPAGSTLNLVNLGYALGRGGEGGRARTLATIDLTGSDGRAGGHAIKGPGTGVTFNVTNVGGYIWGGGGGGGSGQVTADPGSAGAGGGGAGGGYGGSAVAGPSAAGADGTTGINGTYGAGGTAAGSANNGGIGGDWGTAGTTPSSGTTGGAAGKAIEANGGTVTFISGSGSPNVKGAVS